jgi:hypothetical protein
MLSRTYCVVFHEKSLFRRYPLELLPFGVGALEVIANSLVIAIIAGHPFHPHWLVNIAGFLTLIKHSITVVCWLLGVVAVLIGLKSGFNDRKLE